MKLVLLVLSAIIASPVWATKRHPAEVFVESTLIEGQKIMQRKSGKDRHEGMCKLLHNKMDHLWISSTWLGDYAALDREKKAVATFRNMVPEILIVSGIGLVGTGEISGSFRVLHGVEDRGNKVYAVTVEFMTADKKKFVGKVLVHNASGDFKVFDGEYENLSAVQAQAAAFKQIMDDVYQKDPKKSMPVTELIKWITGLDNYAACP